MSLINTTHIITRSSNALAFSFDPKRRLIPEPYIVAAGQADPATLSRHLQDLHESPAWALLFDLWAPGNRLDRVTRAPRPQSEIIRRLAGHAQGGSRQQLDALFVYGTALALGLVSDPQPLTWIEIATERVVSPNTLRGMARASQLGRATFAPFVKEVNDLIANSAPGRADLARMSEVAAAVRKAAATSGLETSRVWEDAARMLDDVFILARASADRTKTFPSLLATDPTFRKIVGTFNFYLDATVDPKGYDGQASVDMLERAKRALDSIEGIKNFGIEYRRLDDFAQDYLIKRRPASDGCSPEGIEIALPLHAGPPSFVTQKIDGLAQSFEGYMKIDSGRQAAYARIFAPVTAAFQPDAAAEIARSFATAAGGLFTQAAVDSVELFALGLAASRSYMVSDSWSMTGRGNDEDLDPERGLSWPRGSFIFQREPRYSAFAPLAGTEAEARSSNPMDVLAYGRHGLEGNGRATDTFADVRKALTSENAELTLISIDKLESRAVSHGMVVSMPRGSKLQIPRVKFSLLGLAAPRTLGLGQIQVLDFPAAAAVVRAAVAYREAIHLGGSVAAIRIANHIDGLLLSEPVRRIFAEMRRRSRAVMQVHAVTFREEVVKLIIEIAKRVTSAVSGSDPRVIGLFDDLQRYSRNLAEEPGFSAKIINMATT